VINRRAAMAVGVAAGTLTVVAGLTGVQRLPLGPDAPTVSAGAIATRTAAANRLQAQIAQGTIGVAPVSAPVSAPAGQASYVQAAPVVSTHAS